MFKRNHISTVWNNHCRLFRNTLCKIRSLSLQGQVVHERVVVDFILTTTFFVKKRIFFKNKRIFLNSFSFFSFFSVFSFDLWYSAGCENFLITNRAVSHPGAAYSYARKGEQHQHSVCSLRCEFCGICAAWSVTGCAKNERR